MNLSQSAKFTGDPFSVVVAALGTQSVRATGLEAAGDWSLAFDGRGRLKLVALTRGRCWIVLPGERPEELVEGDVIILSNARYVVASDPAIRPADGMPLYAGQDIARLGAGDSTVMMGGGSGFADGSGSFVLDALPPFLRIERDSPSAEAAKRTLASLREEIGGAALGSSFIAERLAEILVVTAVRAFVATHPTNSVGWITALADPRIGKALRLLHGDAARRWTAPMLASEVGMSRSAFTHHFTARVGRPPLDYLVHWRMVLARRQLARGETVAHVASAVGYSSQSSFTHAFKRTFGETPRSSGRRVRKVR